MLGWPIEAAGSRLPICLHSIFFSLHVGYAWKKITYRGSRLGPDLSIFVLCAEPAHNLESALPLCQCFSARATTSNCTASFDNFNFQTVRHRLRRHAHRLKSSGQLVADAAQGELLSAINTTGEPGQLSTRVSIGFDL